MQAFGHVLVVSGIPGAGKTEFSKWLANRGWFRIEMDRVFACVPAAHDIEARWHAVLSRSITTSQFLDEVHRSGCRVVIEWGFAIGNIPQVRLLRDAGFEIWWFDGDVEACRTSWKKVWGDADRPFEVQTRSLAAHAAQIADLYQGHTVRTVEANGSRLTCAEIASKIFGVLGV